MHIAMSPDIIFDIGPADDSNNSCLYEYSGSETPILALNNFNEKLLIFIFKKKETTICPIS